VYRRSVTVLRGAGLEVTAGSAQSCRLFQGRPSGLICQFSVLKAVPHLDYVSSEVYSLHNQNVRINLINSFQSAGLYFVFSRSSMEAGVRLYLGGGTGMARPAPLRSQSSIRGWRESLTEVER